MANYLRECLGRHGDVTRALYGKRQELREIERRASGIIESGRLSYDDVATIIHAQFWRGGTFWQWPTREEFNERCEGDAVEGLSVLPKRENAIVDRLLRIFRHIEPVSVVMRFVAPRNFGILSPPVEKLLEIGPAHKAAREVPEVRQGSSNPPRRARLRHRSRSRHGALGYA